MTKIFHRVTQAGSNIPMTFIFGLGMKVIFNIPRIDRVCLICYKVLSPCVRFSVLPCRPVGSGFIKGCSGIT
jgi:hypothetical protein